MMMEKGTVNSSGEENISAVRVHPPLQQELDVHVPFPPSSTQGVERG